MIFHKTFFFNVAIILICCYNLTYAQNTTGQHVVVKGDNIYRLSLRYKVTMEALFESNPGSRSLIRIGDLLNIPEQNNNESITSNPSSSRNYNFKRHKVLKGETKYGLSKQYNYSIADLERTNPEIVNMLLAGTIIRIPDNTYATETIVNTKTSEKNSHTVTRGETLWSISQQYGMSLAELKAVNPQKNNNIILIGELLTVTPPPSGTSTYIVVKGDTKYGLSKRFNITIAALEQMNPNIIPMLKSGSTIKISDSETIPNTHSKKDNSITTIDSNNAEANTTSKIVDYTIKPKETLFGLAKKANMTIDEFLLLNPALSNGVIEGSLIRMPAFVDTIDNTAITSPSPVNKNGFNVSILWEDSSTISNTNAIEQKANYLIGLNKAIDSISFMYPYNKIKFNNVKAIDSQSEYSKSINVFPANSLGEKLINYADIDFISLLYYDNISNKKILIKSKPTAIDMRNSVLAHLKQQNKKIICIYDQEHKANIEAIQTMFPKAEFISTKKNGNFKSGSLKKLLEPNLDYAVIIESDKVGIYLRTTTMLLKEKSNKKPIQLIVLNSKNIPSNTNITDKRFSILQLLYPQSFDTNQRMDTNITTTYSFAFNYDLLNRLFSNGLQGIDNQITSKSGYSFTYDFTDNIYKNKAVKLYMYGDDSKHIEVKPY